MNRRGFLRNLALGAVVLVGHKWAVAKSNYRAVIWQQSEAEGAFFGDGRHGDVLFDGKREYPAFCTLDRATRTYTFHDIMQARNLAAMPGVFLRTNHYALYASGELDLRYAGLTFV